MLLGCVQTPEPHTSFVHWFVSGVQTVPLSSLFARQAPEPLQLSGLSQSVFAGLPQAVPGELLGCEQTPAVHTSFVHGFVSGVQGVPLGFVGLLQSPVAGSQVPAK